MSRNLLIVYHSQSGRTETMARAVLDGARDPQIESVDVRFLRAASAGPDDLLWAHGLLLGTPENFGYMSGAMKDFFDRTFYPVEGRIQSLPYAAFVSAGNDGTGTRRDPLQRLRLQPAKGGFPLGREDLLHAGTRLGHHGLGLFVGTHEDRLRAGHVPIKRWKEVILCYVSC